MIKLGDRVKDKIIGFVGIAVAQTNWLYGCVRIGVQSEELTKDGNVLDPVWIDEGQLEEIAREKVKKTGEPPVGGHRADPVRNLDPIR